MVSVAEVNYRALWEEGRQGLSALIRIPSVYDAATVSPSAPFGEPVRAALAFMEARCTEAGFAVRNYGGRVLTASFGIGERVDVVSHLDVVAVADDWSSDPFSGELRDGFVYGRGAQDMKAGAWLTFLALKALKESGVTPKRELRLVFGSDEERTMEDMRFYVREAGLPAFAFTPDCRFPMTVGEKGALMWTAEGAYRGAVLRLASGIQPNIVPPCAEALMKADPDRAAAVIDALGAAATAEETPEGVLLRAAGVGAHASQPQLGKSAFTELVRVLADLTGEPFWARLRAFFEDPYGSGAGMTAPEGPMGCLTLNPGVVKVENGRFFAMVDCRYPFGMDSGALTERFARAFPKLRIALPYDDAPTFAGEDDRYIRALKDAYRETLGVPCATVISGGVSYSKVFGHSVTFGPVGESSEDLAHQRDERISENDCVSALEIYLRAFRRLAEADL